MKKTLLIAALASAALVSCSKDEVVKINQDEIKFSVVADNQTKAEAVYCANNLITEFDVCATYTKTGETTAQWYFQNDHIIKDGSAWVNETNTRYWSEGTHDFYAIYNGTMNVSGIAETPAVPTVNFSPSAVVANQLDLLYAVAKGKVKDNPTVALNFRHALSQIEFRAKNTNPQLYVEITDVKVGQTPGTGVFTYPSVATDDKFVDHSQVTTHTYTTGTWSVSVPADYTATFTAVKVKGDNTLVGLTLSEDKNNVDNSMLLLPTPATTAWTPASNTANVYNGTYLGVKCKIYNVAGAAYASTDVCLHDGWAYIPVSFTWDPGKKYIYTFVFGEGNGGYNDNGNPVLTPISYTVTVDDFQKGVDAGVDMKF